MIVATLAAAACSDQITLPESAAIPGTAPDGGHDLADPLVVEVPRDDNVVFLDPDAGPTTALGRLRAQYLPVWSHELDWAFPPDACGSAWELDAIARPDARGDVNVLGDAAMSAARSVLRFEHEVAQAFQQPNELAQLCVGTASVDPVRNELLGALEPLVRAGTGEQPETGQPAGVTVVASAPGWALTVACSPELAVRPDADAGIDDAAAETSRDSDDVNTGTRARLGAYLLALSVGQEDSVTDVSWRVAQVRYEPAAGCDGLDAWQQQWTSQTREWSDRGQAWLHVDATFTARDLCGATPSEGTDECAREEPA